ncbi:hypothetical protein [Lapillicoccus sp.]|uniref:hypothetical protein n=1 Tax=Lapillicoccus sp. TaxID=1909287 RepID=UPI0025E3319A|nr:hypothetical protein [Lapillicoccus sp.]
MSGTRVTPEAPPTAAPSTAAPPAAAPPKEVFASPLPGWMAPVLLVTAGAGLALMLRTLYVCFTGAGPYDGQVLVMTRFVDRATWWVMVGPGGASSWATLAALVASTVVVLGRRDHPSAVPDRLRLVGVGLAVLLFLVELSGPLTVAVGWFMLTRTAATSFWDHDLVNGPQLMLCLVLAVLAGLIAWVLRSGLTTSDETPQPDSSGAGVLIPWADEVAALDDVEPEVVETEVVVPDHSELYRRPVR